MGGVFTGGGGKGALFHQKNSVFCPKIKKFSVFHAGFLSDMIYWTLEMMRQSIARFLNNLLVNEVIKNLAYKNVEHALAFEIKKIFVSGLSFCPKYSILRVKLSCQKFSLVLLSSLTTLL